MVEGATEGVCPLVGTRVCVSCVSERVLFLHTELHGGRCCVFFPAFFFLIFLGHNHI